MSWPASLVVALLTAVVGMLVSGFVANLAVGWYRVSGFEGGAGYFMVSLALLGFAAGLVIGLVVCRTMATGGGPVFLRALGLSQAILLALVAVVGGAARARADVPPRLDGDELLLAVEVRLPAGHTASPDADPARGFLRLGSVTRGSRVMRASVRGPLWKRDARLVDGRWVVPGAVQVFTTRGMRMLEIALDDSAGPAFVVPVPARPGAGDLGWSAWMPREGGDRAAPDTGLAFRYRVQRESEPVRTDVVGPFEVRTIAGGFAEVAVEQTSRIATVATFALRFRGEPLPVGAEGRDRADAVTVVSRTPPALLVHVDAPGGGGSCHLLVADGDRVRAEPVGECAPPIEALPLTSDPARFRAARGRGPMLGEVDRDTFAGGGLFLVGNAVIDAGRLTVRRVTGVADASGVPAVPPLALSRDARSFARFGYADGSETRPVLAVTDAVADRSYLVPIDPARMHFSTLDDLDPAWVAHHFEWRRGPDGVDRLVERAAFAPLPYRGRVETYGDGSTNYRLEPGGEPLRAALIEFLVTELGAERLAAEPGGYQIPVRVDGRTVKVAASGDFGYVAVSADRGDGGAEVVGAIARRFDAALATGRYDALFRRPER